MTSKLKCPFCETELEQGIELLRGGHILGCPNCKRNADDIFWFALIQAKQDLKIARKALDKMRVGNVPRLPDETLANAMCNYARDTLKQIEHKE